MINLEEVKVGKKDFILKKEDIWSNFTEITLLGKGRYGTVSKAKHKILNLEVAVKKISKWNLANLEYIRREIEILCRLDHPYITRLYEYYETDTDFYLVFELCSGGELFGRIKDNGHFNEQYGAFVMRQLMCALNYCHSIGIAHRDVKPENCLFSTKDLYSSLKLIDYGLAKIFEDPKYGKLRMSSRVGTPFYIAPEVLSYNYTEKCDIWSAGVVFYACVLGGLPFGGSSESEIFSCIKRGFRGFPKVATLSDDCKSLISSMLQFDPRNRPTAFEVLSHPWFTHIDRSVAMRDCAPEVVQNLAMYQGMEKLKKIVLLHIGTQMADQEIEALIQVFNKLDEDKDGRLSLEELAKGLKSLKNRDEMMELMKSMDLDKSGFIDYSEFLAAAMPANLYLNIEKLKHTFSTFDKDKDQKISIAEIQEIVDKEKVLPMATWNELIKKADTDKDGFLTFEEFYSAMQGYESDRMMTDVEKAIEKEKEESKKGKKDK